MLTKFLVVATSTGKASGPGQTASVIHFSLILPLVHSSCTLLDIISTEDVPLPDADLHLAARRSSSQDSACNSSVFVRHGDAEQNLGELVV